VSKIMARKIFLRPKKLRLRQRVRWFAVQIRAITTTSKIFLEEQQQLYLSDARNISIMPPYCKRSGGIGTGMLSVLAATPIPPWQVFGGKVQPVPCP